MTFNNLDFFRTSKLGFEATGSTEVDLNAGAFTAFLDVVQDGEGNVTGKTENESDVLIHCRKDAYPNN